jgi:putative transposase
LLHAIVHAADIQDRDGGIMLLATMFGLHPFLKKLFADAAYQGPEFHNRLAHMLPYLETEIVKRSDCAKGFEILPKRWIVERTIAWLNRCRRLAKDWENLNRKGLAFLRLASTLHAAKAMQPDMMFPDRLTWGGRVSRGEIHLRMRNTPVAVSVSKV